MFKCEFTTEFFRTAKKLAILTLKNYMRDSKNKFIQKVTYAVYCELNLEPLRFQSDALPSEIIVGASIDFWT